MLKRFVSSAYIPILCCCVLNLIPLILVHCISLQLVFPCIKQQSKDRGQHFLTHLEIGKACDKKPLTITLDLTKPGAYITYIHYIINNINPNNLYIFYVRKLHSNTLLPIQLWHSQMCFVISTLRIFTSSKTCSQLTNPPV